MGPWEAPAAGLENAVEGVGPVGADGGGVDGGGVGGGGADGTSPGDVDGSGPDDSDEGYDDGAGGGRPGWAGGTGAMDPALEGRELRVEFVSVGRRRRVGVPRRRSVTVRLSEEERFDVVAAANRVGLTAGAYLADAAVAAARGTAGPRADGRRQVAIELNQLWTQVARLGGNLNQAVKVANATGAVDGRLLGAAAQTKGLLDRITLAVDETHAGMRR